MQELYRMINTGYDEETNIGIRENRHQKSDPESCLFTIISRNMKAENMIVFLFHIFLRIFFAEMNTQNSLVINR